MIREATYKLFYTKFERNNIVTVNLLMKELKISRPTATQFVKELIEFTVIEPIFTISMDKSYKVIK